MGLKLLRVALKVKNNEGPAYAAVFIPATVLFMALSTAYLGTSASSLVAAAIAGTAMGLLACAGLWLFTESQINHILSTLEYHPTNRLSSPQPVEKALARVVRILSDRAAVHLPLRVGEPAFYSPKPFVAILLKRQEAGETQVSIAFDPDDAGARGLAELLESNLSIE